MFSLVRSFPSFYYLKVFYPNLKYIHNILITIRAKSFLSMLSMGIYAGPPSHLLSNLSIIDESVIYDFLQKKCTPLRSTNTSGF